MLEREAEEQKLAHFKANLNDEKEAFYAALSAAQKQAELAQAQRQAEVQRRLTKQEEEWKAQQVWCPSSCVR